MVLILVRVVVSPSRFIGLMVISTSSSENALIAIELSGVRRQLREELLEPEKRQSGGQRRRPALNLQLGFLKNAADLP